MREIKLLFLIISILFILINCNMANVASSDISTSPSTTNLYKIKVDGKWGFIDKNGNVVITPQFIIAENFSEGLAKVGTGGRHGRYGFIDTKGNIVIKLQFNYATSFNEGLASVHSKNTFTKVGFIDKNGDYVIKPQIRVVSTLGFSEGLAPVSISRFFGFKDKNGEYIIKPQHGVGPNKWGFIDKNGSLVIHPRFDKALKFSEGLAAVCIDDKWGFIDKSGNMIIKPQFVCKNIFCDIFLSFHEGLAAISNGDKNGFIDKSGKFVIKPQFDFTGNFSEGLAAVCVDKKCGFIDKKGNYVIKLQYLPPIGMVLDFREGLAAVNMGGKYGYIDKNGNIVINPQFDFADNFREGLAYVKTHGEHGYIDNNGKYVWIQQLVVKTEPNPSEGEQAEAEAAAMQVGLLLGGTATQYDQCVAKGYIPPGEQKAEDIVRLYFEKSEQEAPDEKAKKTFVYFHKGWDTIKQKINEQPPKDWKEDCARIKEQWKGYLNKLK